MKENINEHDMTKRMMEIMRGGYNKTSLKEVEEMAVSSDANLPVAPNNQPSVNRFDSDDQKDTITMQPSDPVFQDEAKKLRDIVGTSAKINDFKIFPTQGNVIISGSLNQGEGENTGIQFIMSLLARKIQITMNNVEVDDEVDTELTKLRGHYKNFEDEWDTKMATEYQPKEQ
jgi:hypothetical protein